MCAFQKRSGLYEEVVSSCYWSYSSMEGTNIWSKIVDESQELWEHLYNIYYKV